MATHGEEVVLGGQSRPPRERGPSASNKFFAGFLSIYAYTLYPRIPVPVLPNFGVLLYLTQNDQIQHGNKNKNSVVNIYTPCVLLGSWKVNDVHLV